MNEHLVDRNLKLPIKRYRKSLTAYSDNLKSLLGTTSPSILEIGCNDGEDSTHFMRIFPESNLFCFEPEPRAILEWRKRNLGKRCKLFEVALSDRNGSSRFYQSGGTVRDVKDWNKSGSLNRPVGHLEYCPQIHFKQSIQVKIMTLDSFAAEFLSEGVIDLIWMDVQGGESNVIKGGRNVLKRVRYIYTEFGHWKRPLYVGQMNLQETLRFLGKGWKPLGIYEGYNLLAKNVVLE